MRINMIKWHGATAQTVVLMATMAQAQDTGGFGAMMRFGCAQHSIERLDPLVQPGTVPSQHVHAIVGGNSFNATMTGNVGEESTCTTCTFSEDFSNYWHPALYFRARNGTFKHVPIIANEGIFGASGGITVYYTSPEDTAVKITAPPPGFRMVVGNPTARTRNARGAAYNIYRCYSNGAFDPNPMGVADTDTSEFPKQHCPGGIRVNINFPNCWDGKTLDSADHTSHVRSGYNGCPTTHPVRLPQIMLETVFNTGVFPQSEWPTDGTQPFVWAQGDGTGYGFHADYVFGWKGDSLQRAVDQRCGLDRCNGLATQQQSVGNRCTKPQSVVDDLQAWVPELPGGMVVTYA
ncbi:hypothetical protein CAC42_4435 [Sphaceloma murrayae]|uniref:DUF1996 domain-containing protein n=1 Tax=Sphaceloma murrayae TaxID=2082308 RepID=A0A2K1QLK5_9PEZI|nr:hypothetical protein CAC42_4435 [Sphaceloma murrayae]